MAMQNLKRQLTDRNDDLKCKKNKSQHIQQDFVNYVSITPLENMAIVNIATAICKQSDIRDAIIKHSIEFDTPGNCNRGTRFDESLDEINKNLFKKVHILPLPNLLKAEVSNAIENVAIQILDWLCYNCKDLEHFESIYWTNEGTIDRGKSVENIINVNDFSQLSLINDSFEMACIGCMEAIIPQLWEKLPEKTQKACLQMDTWPYNEYDRHLIAYWVCTVNDQLSMLISKIKAFDHRDIYNCNHSVYKNMFTLAVLTVNSLAVKYFWKKLTTEEITSNLAQWINNLVHIIEDYEEHLKYTNKFASVLYFLLGKLKDTEQQREIFQKHSKFILLSLYEDWPWQRFLLPTIRLMWDFLDAEIYVQFLSSIVPHIKETKNTEKLLRRLWFESPIDLKICFIQYIVNDHSGTNILCNLLAVKDVETIKEILNYANVEEKKWMFFSVIKNPKFQTIYVNHLPVFNLLVDDIFSSASDVKNLKETLVVELGNALCHSWICDNNWQRVEIFLTWTFATQVQIDNFKNEVLKKMEITHSLLGQGNYVLVNRFLHWCYGSEEEIIQFKKDFAKSNLEIVELGNQDWSLFEAFLSWCFSSEQEINEFKVNLFQSSKLKHIIFSNILYRYNFEFVDELITWCCHSNEEIKQYKENFVLSELWISILKRFVSNIDVCDSKWSNWELTKKLVKLFPLHDEDLKVLLKNKIEEKVNFDHFMLDFRKNSFKIRKKQLFYLLDDDDDSSINNSESDNDSEFTDNEDDDYSRNNSESDNDSDLTDKGDDHNIS